MTEKSRLCCILFSTLLQIGCSATSLRHDLEFGKNAPRKDSLEYKQRLQSIENAEKNGGGSADWSLISIDAHERKDVAAEPEYNVHKVMVMVNCSVNQMAVGVPLKAKAITWSYMSPTGKLESGTAVTSMQGQFEINTLLRVGNLLSLGLQEQRTRVHVPQSGEIAVSFDCNAIK